MNYEYRHLGKPLPVHRATEPATAPIGQEAPENSASSDAEPVEVRLRKNLWDRIRKVEHDNNQAAARIRRLEADLAECREYLEKEMDVVDGDYGQPAPNRAMQLCSMIDETLNGPGAV